MSLQAILLPAVDEIKISLSRFDHFILADHLFSPGSLVRHYKANQNGSRLSDESTLPLR
jgi:hypothetical protein